MSGIMAALLGSISSTVGGAVGTPDLSPYDSQYDANATASLALNTSGAYTSSNDTSGDYCSPTALASQLEARLTYVSGTALTSGSAVGVWLPLTSSRSWSLTSFLEGGLSSVYTLELREGLSHTVRDSSTISFSVFSDYLPI